jgi:hypothetical protein
MFDVLWLFKKLNAFGHTNATDFYCGIAHLTDAKCQRRVAVSFDNFVVQVDAERTYRIARVNSLTWHISGCIRRC